MARSFWILALILSGVLPLTQSATGLPLPPPTNAPTTGPFQRAQHQAFSFKGRLLGRGATQNSTGGVASSRTRSAYSRNGAPPPTPAPSPKPEEPPIPEEPTGRTLGVVWTPPSVPDSALHELGRIASMGATAVRLTRLPSDTVAARADSLGLRLYVDLPVEYVAAPQLADRLARAAPALNQLRRLARRHASITHVGLAHNADTTVPRTCETLRRWTARVHAWDTATLQTYYVTPFTADADQCASAVDRVFLDLRGHPTPVDQWRQWHTSTTAVGVGALGTWRAPTAAPGLRVPHSPERQARYLERALSRLIDSSRTTPSVVFVSRWQDRSRPPLSSRRYGLHTRNGSPHPAARVVRGIYMGRQRVFAFPAGSPNERGPYRLTLLGWGLVALLGGLYARSPFVRETGIRYFTAPGFYRDALHDRRDLSPGVHGLLLGVVAGALGTTSASAARLAVTAPATQHVLSALPEGLRYVLATGLEHPITAGLLTGGMVGILLLTWILVLVLMARGWTRFSLAQGLALVVWPCWPALLILPLALATGPDAPLSPSLFGLLLLGGVPLALFYVTGRVLFDYWAITDLPGWTLLPLGALSPLALVGATVLVHTVRYEVSFAFLWHLATLITS